MIFISTIYTPQLLINNLSLIVQNTSFVKKYHNTYKQIKISPTIPSQKNIPACTNNAPTYTPVKHTTTHTITYSRSHTNTYPTPNKNSYTHHHPNPNPKLPQHLTHTKHPTNNPTTKSTQNIPMSNKPGPVKIHTYLPKEYTLKPQLSTTTNRHTSTPSTYTPMW